jgi:C4-dicarboxylate-specific signal transduction histidine kinase
LLFVASLVGSVALLAVKADFDQVEATSSSSDERGLVKCPESRVVLSSNYQFATRKKVDSQEAIYNMTPRI